MQEKQRERTREARPPRREEAGTEGAAEEEQERLSALQLAHSMSAVGGNGDADLNL